MSEALQPEVKSTVRTQQPEIEGVEPKQQHLKFWLISPNPDAEGSSPFIPGPQLLEANVGYGKYIRGRGRTPESTFETLKEKCDFYLANQPDYLPDIVLITDPEPVQKRLTKLEEIYRALGKKPPIPKTALPESDISATKIINWLRNNPALPKQPVIVTLTNTKMHNGEARLAAGADIDIPNERCNEQFLQDARTVPDILNNVEDSYADKIVRYKHGFYDEYHEKLKDRSQITADTEQETAILREVFEQNNVHDMLDAGCGSGRIARPLAEAGYNVTGIDVSGELLQEAKAANENLEHVSQPAYAEGDLRALPVVSESEDAITYNWHVFCEFLGNKNKQAVLSEAFRVLRPGGVAVLDIPDREQLNEQKDGIYLDNPGGEHLYIGYVPDEAEMRQHLERAGFTEIKTRRWVTHPEDPKAQHFPKLTFVAKKPTTAKPES